MLSTMLGSCAGTAHGAPRQTDLKGTLFAFISEAAAANIVSGVQVSLLNELAVQFAGAGNDVDEAGPVQQARACQPVQTASLGSTLQRDPNVPQTLEHSGGLPNAPQLQIQPLNLSAGLQEPVQASASQQDAAGFTAAATLASDAAAEDMSNRAAALMALTGGMAGSYDAAAAAAALFQQQQPYPAAAAGQKLPDIVMSSLLGPSHELLQALAYAGDASAAAAAAAPFGVAADPGGIKASSTRKQRFSREQHAAILESVERNYAQYPSRYTELVIKEMQARFPGIELNNACVRKIKFRANEAIKQQQPGQQQLDYLGLWPDQQAAADAAAGLVDLASAAAAAAAAYGDADMEAAFPPFLSASDQLDDGDLAAPVKTEAVFEEGCQQQEDAAAAAAGCTEGTAAASAQHDLAAQTSNSPETVCISEEPAGAALLAATTAADEEEEEEQQQQQQQQQHASKEPEPGCAEAAAAEPASLSPSSSALLLKVPQAPQADSQGPSVAAAGAEECVDSATAAAAEAMNLLAGISRGSKQQAGSTVDQDSSAAAAAAGYDVQDSGVADAAAAAAAGSKRKRESPPACEGATSGVAASSPLPAPVAEALSAAADLTDGSSMAAAQEQLALQQAGLDPSYMPAAYNQQQQQFMQQLLQLQQQQPWDLAYGVVPGFAAASAVSSSAQAAAAAAAAAGPGCQQPSAKRQRLSGAQMAELVASVKHHVQANPERYTHCVIKDMKEKYPDLELNMGQIRKIKFRTLGNASTTKQASKGSDSAAADSDPSSSAAGAAGGCGVAPWM